MGAKKKKKYPLIQIGELERAIGTSSGQLSFPDSAGWPLLIASLRAVQILGYILYTQPLILEEVKRDVLFYGRDPESVGNRTAVLSPLTGAIMSPGSKQLFPSFLPEGLAPTSGTRRTPTPNLL